MIIITTVLFPHATSSKVAKKNIEMMKKYPPDPSIGTLLTIAIKASIEGMRVHAIFNVAKGKVAEAMGRFAQQYQEYALEIDGFKYQLDTFMDVPEAYKILGMEPPEE